MESFFFISEEIDPRWEGKEDSWKIIHARALHSLIFDGVGYIMVAWNVYIQKQKVT